MASSLTLGITTVEDLLLNHKITRVDTKNSVQGNVKTMQIFEMQGKNGYSKTSKYING
jgi:hypothetical protein